MHGESNGSPGGEGRRPPVASGSGSTAGWPRWAKLAASAFLGFHLVAILAGGVGAPPSSAVQRRAALWFGPYFGLINQGYGYRYYARLDTTVDPDHPRPWSTPVVTLALEFDREGGGVDREEVRLPALDRAWPRLRHQRELDLAYHVSADPRWAASLARHLCKTRGASRVTVYAQEHRIPDLHQALHAASRGEAIDLDGDSTYTPRVNLGDFRCGDF